jgi:hypothetical protein
MLHNAVIFGRCALQETKITVKKLKIDRSKVLGFLPVAKAY